MTNSNSKLTETWIDLDELCKKIFKDLQCHIFSGTEEEDVVDHIDDFLKILDQIKTAIFNTNQLRINIFPLFLSLSLTEDAKIWWLNVRTIKSRLGECLPEECWWKVNAHEITPFTRMENFRRRSYVNIKTEWARNPYLDINRTFGRDYEGNNNSCTQENQGHMGNPIPEPSNCKVKRFKMMKYSFDDDNEYITIKESECLKHSKDSLDAYQELLHLINEGWVVTTPDK
ncbi:hypothetical protein Tco_0267769 [Tanacetum coccineum]